MVALLAAGELDGQGDEDEVQDGAPGELDAHHLDGQGDAEHLDAHEDAAADRGGARRAGELHPARGCRRATPR